jgi:hypothetical protein
MSREKAHFFWYGKPMSVYESLCIKSFIKNNFDVYLWTFGKTDVPDGVRIEDAEQFYSRDSIETFTQAGVKGSLPSFASAFRLELLSVVDGWWFDTDCFCLRDQIDFQKLTESRQIVAGWEDNRHINNGVLNFKNKEIAQKAKILRDEILNYRNRNLEWGDIGPRLITMLVKNNNLEKDILTHEYFYPEHYTNALDALDPKKTETLLRKTQNSYVYHYWNEIFNRNNVDKSQLPISGSYLREKFNSLII